MLVRFPRKDPSNIRLEDQILATIILASHLFVFGVVLMTLGGPALSSLDMLQIIISARIGRVSPLAPRVTKRIKCFANSFQEILLSLAPSSSSFPLPVIWGFSNVHWAISCFPQLIASNLNFFYLLSHFTTHSSDF